MFQFQSYQPTAQPPPPPKTDERLAKIWVDQEKVDYKAALFLMGAAPLSLTVALPEEYAAEAERCLRSLASWPPLSLWHCPKSDTAHGPRSNAHA